MRREEIGRHIVCLMREGIALGEIAHRLNAMNVICPYGSSWDAIRVQAIAACDFALGRISDAEMKP